MINDTEIDLIRLARHGDPFSVLGPHTDLDGRLWLRAFLPGATHVVAVDAVDGTTLVPLLLVHVDGLFEGALLALPAAGYRLQVRWADGNESLIDDPYRFGPVLGELDAWLLSEGSHLRPFETLGAMPRMHEGVAGCSFAVWAPNAARVSVVGDFNGWDGRRHPMRLRRECGIWEIFLPGVGEGACYKFELLSQDGQLLPQKVDPYARRAELRPATASVVAPLPPVQPVSAARQRANALDAPMSIYEVHLGSWRRHVEDGNRWLTWDELADQLVGYAAHMGFTHLELLPITEHPFDGSWGYQTLGLYAPTARFGEPAGLARLIERAHAAGIGVLLDWVPAHFPTDAHGLAQFDGSALYEYADPREGFHQDWNTLIYNFGRTEVRNFLVGNALYWLLDYRFDGLRFDAVHAIPDPGWLDEMAAAVRAATPGRHVHLMLENEHNTASHLDGDFDAQWNDDAHNALHVLLTGEREGYYANYAGRAGELFVRCLGEGFGWQGEPSPGHDGRPRGTPSAHLPASAFVFFLQNHDQIGNRALGERLLALCAQAGRLEAWRAALAVQLLCPQVPLLFMGDELGSTTPFLFFTDFHDELAEAVREGRRREFAQFAAFADPERRAAIPDPNAGTTFESSRPQPGDPEDLACVDGQADVLQRRAERIVRRQAETAYLQHRAAFADEGRRLADRQLATDHHARQAGRRLVPRGGAARHLAAPHDRGGVTQGLDLVELVADVEDGDPLRGELAQGLEELEHRLGREDRGGLIEDQQLGILQQAADDLHALAFAHRQAVHRARRVHRQAVLAGLGADALGHLRQIHLQPRILGQHVANAGGYFLAHTSSFRGIRLTA